jgi:NAD(P)H-nitrite reductase large subunit
MAGGNKKYSGGFFMNSVEILEIPSISMGLTNIEDKEEKGIEVLKDFNPDKNTYKKVIIRNNRIIGVILVGNIERAGIYAGLIRNEIDISGVKENISREDFGIIHLPADYKKHLVVGEGIEV